jgi:hypothetical protein
MHVKSTMMHKLYTFKTICQFCLNFDPTENGVLGPLRATPSVLAFRKAIVSLPFS